MVQLSRPDNSVIAQVFGCAAIDVEQCAAVDRSLTLDNTNNPDTRSVRAAVAFSSPQARKPHLHVARSSPTGDLSFILCKAFEVDATQSGGMAAFVVDGSGIHQSCTGGCMLTEVSEVTEKCP